MSIVFDENKRVFKLDTEKSSYAFHITDSRNLLHLYYGGYIPETDITHMLRIPSRLYLRYTTLWDLTALTVRPSNFRHRALRISENRQCR